MLHLPRPARLSDVLTATSLLLLSVFLTAPLPAIAQATLFAEGIASPAGIYVDDDGHLWVASLGSGNDDAGIYVVTPQGEVHPFMTGLPSSIVQGEPSGTNHVYFNNDVELLVVQGQGAGDLSGSVLLVDTTGFTPGDDPLGPGDVGEVFPVSDFVIGELGGESNPYAMTFVPSSPTSYVSDAAANAIVEGSDGGLSILATLDDVPNTGSQGPPMVDAVPTGLDYDETTGRLYVGTLTGFPFNEEAATIFEIDMEGNVAPLLVDRTTVVDLQVIPGGGGLVFLEHRFAPAAGRLYKWENGELTELATGLNRPAGLRIGLHGEVYISLLEDGQIVRVDGVVTSTRSEIPVRSPEFRVETYPNPFVDYVTLAVDRFAAAPGDYLSLRIVDVLGRTVFAAAHEASGPTTARLTWHGRSSTGLSLPPGPYFYEITSKQQFSRGALIKN